MIISLLDRGWQWQTLHCKIMICCTEYLKLILKKTTFLDQNWFIVHLPSWCMCHIIDRRLTPCKKGYLRLRETAMLLEYQQQNIREIDVFFVYPKQIIIHSGILAVSYALVRLSECMDDAKNRTKLKIDVYPARVFPEFPCRGLHLRFKRQALIWPETSQKFCSFKVKAQFLKKFTTAAVLFCDETAIVILFRPADAIRRRLILT